MIHPIDIDMLENVARKLDGIQQIVGALEMYTDVIILDASALNVLWDMLISARDDQNAAIKAFSEKVTIKPTVAVGLKRAG